MKGMLAMPASNSFIEDNTTSRLEARPPGGREEAIELPSTVFRVSWDPQIVTETMNATFVDRGPLRQGHSQLMCCYHR